MELAGYTARVATMCEVFEDCSEGRYTRKAVVTATKQVWQCMIFKLGNTEKSYEKPKSHGVSNKFAGRWRGQKETEQLIVSKVCSKDV